MEENRLRTCQQMRPLVFAKICTEGRRMRDVNTQGTGKQNSHPLALSSAAPHFSKLVAIDVALSALYVIKKLFNLLKFQVT